MPTGSARHWSYNTAIAEKKCDSTTFSILHHVSGSRLLAKTRTESKYGLPFIKTNDPKVFKLIMNLVYCTSGMVLGLTGQRSRLGLRLTAIRRGFELYEYLLVSTIIFCSFACYRFSFHHMRPAQLPAHHR